MMDTIDLYEQLKPKIGEKEAKDLLAYINESVKTNVATKADITALDAKVELVRTELGSSITHLKTELGSRIGRLEEKLEGAA